MEARARVFLAEDNDDLADLITRRLQGRGAWRVTRERTMKDAAARLEGDRFDVVVLDYRLPDGTGLDLLRVVRTAAPETPVLFLTGHGSEDVALKALGMGASDYMQKDSGLFEELPRRLDALLERSGDIAAGARVVPVQGPGDDARAAVAAPLTPEAAREALHACRHPDVLGAAIFDGAGRILAAELPAGMDPTRLGAAAFQLHAEVGIVARLADLTPRRYEFQLEVDGALLFVTTAPGRAILALLLDPQKPGVARERVAELAQRLK